MLLTRIRTGFILLFAGCLFLSLSHIPAVLLVGMGCLSALALAELAGPLGYKKMPMSLIGAGLFALTCCLDRLWLTGLLSVLFIGYLLLSWTMMTALPGKDRFRSIEKLLLLAAIPAFLGAACHLRQGDQGLLTLMLPIFICASTDTLAYFVGRRWGKRPLAPLVSPKKTLEGAIGGGLLAVAAAMVLGLCLELTGFVRVNLVLLCLYSLTASAVGQFGDLCLSAVKRVAGVKDFGDVLPGHGGILDRMDSCLLVMPFTYLFIGCFGPIFL